MDERQESRFAIFLILLEPVKLSCRNFGSNDLSALKDPSEGREDVFGPDLVTGILLYLLKSIPDAPCVSKMPLTEFSGLVRSPRDRTCCQKYRSSSSAFLFTAYCCAARLLCLRSTFLEPDMASHRKKCKCPLSHLDFSLRMEVRTEIFRYR